MWATAIESKKIKDFGRSVFSYILQIIDYLIVITF